MTDWKIWLKYAAIRAVKTMAQTAVAMIGVGSVMSDIDWVRIASASAVAGILSLLTSVAGLPEVKLAGIAQDNEKCYVKMAQEANELRDEIALADEFEVFGDEEAVENE